MEQQALGRLSRLLHQHMHVEESAFAKVASTVVRNMTAQHCFSIAAILLKVSCRLPSDQSKCDKSNCNHLCNMQTIPQCGLIIEDHTT